jgi:hypothetical protein|nr:MAG TPA: Minor capsid protein from bacteriophage [Caudoviricetes sp.]
MVNRYEKISEWLKEYTPRFRWIYFNVTNTEADNLSLNSVQNERELDKFIDGSRRVEFLFALDLVKEYDTGTSSINLEANREFETISEWVELMNKEKHFPDFGENVLIEQIDVLETVPSVTVDTQAGMAKYQGQFKITYMEMKGE